MEHKIFIQEVMNYYRLYLTRRNELSDTESELFKLTRTRTISSSGNSNGLNSNEKFPFTRNKNGSVFLELLLSNEYRNKDLNKILDKTEKVLEDIKEIIKIEGVVRPLKIFWAKIDYAVVGKIVAILVSGIFMIIGTLMNTIDMKNILG